MLSRFRQMLQGPAKPAAKAGPESAANAGPTRHVQYSRQTILLQELYKQIQSHPWNEQTEQSLQQLLDSLQVYTISEYLLLSYPKEQLTQYRTYAAKEFEAMGIANRERMQSLIGLGSDEMQKVISECLFLFEINPSGQAPLELSETESFDANGKPILEKHIYPIFQENALQGVAGLQRFLPQNLLDGEASRNWPGMSEFLKNEYPQLTSGTSPANAQPAIKAITTIGSLGGLGHKPDSDMDAQVILNTNPEYDYRWNDGDFFIALVVQILQAVLNDFLENVLPAPHSQELKQKVADDLKIKFMEGLSGDEIRIITTIFPSTYQKQLEEQVWQLFNKLDPKQQSQLIWKQVGRILPAHPYFEKYLPLVVRFFPALKLLSPEKLLETCFPYSAKQLTREKMIAWLVSFYQDKYLGKNGAQNIVRLYAKKKGTAPEQVSPEAQRAYLLDYLAQLKQRAPILKAFLSFIAERLSLDYKAQLLEILRILQKQFDPQGQFLKESMVNELNYALNKQFREQMVGLADFYSQWEATLNEAQSEYATHRKINLTEAYLTRKYPETEIHLFKNVLRNQRKGQHTPFLVSPEGSMAYSLMLNDFLLNPAVLLCGISPMPFDLPHDLKTLATIGVLPAEEWTFSQPKGSGKETFTLQKLPDWGEVELPREKLLQHAIPIFLRESEKVSHRNLPKALLNCWWVEMLCCQEDSQERPTSLTRLLWNPEQRYFLKHQIQHEWVEAIQLMEKQTPQLIRDPWWLKFTEMLMRFEDHVVRKQITFCFAQHLRLSDIVDFNNAGNPIWVDKNASWRILAMVTYYNTFFKDPQERVDLMKFAQGRDDIGNQMEQTLKKAFLDSMHRVEKKLIDLGNGRALNNIIKYVLKLGEAQQLAPQAFKPFVEEQLKTLNQTMLIADERLLQRANDVENMNPVEQRQLQEILADRSRIKATVSKIMEKLAQLGLQGSGETLEKYILDGRIKLAGDPLENVIFKYHFERNFKRKPFQVPLPISKSLSIPRKKIMVSFNPRSEKWLFKAILSKKEVFRQASNAQAAKTETEIEMFEEGMVEGLARCVFSGYVGFTALDLTSFEKPAVKSNSLIASTPFTHQDMQDLAFAMHEFFSPIRVRPHELLENIYYIRDIFLVCNVNRFGVISAVVRDNLGDCFVINLDLDPIKIKINPAMQITTDEKFPRFFQQFHSKECRGMFLETLGQLKIPLLAKHPPRFKVWVNFGCFELTITPKFYRVYIDGIANELWQASTVASPLHLHPRKLEQTFDGLGKVAIQKHQMIEAEQKQLRERARQKNAIQSRAYLQRKRNELGL